MKVLRANHMGFCFGVRRAVDMILREALKAEGTVYTLGPIIHNPQMVRFLEGKGVVAIDNVGHVREGTVVLRTHGVKKDEEEQLRRRGLRIIDATCPFVKRVRQKAVYLRKNGYVVVIIGDKDHPEVKSVLSYIDNDGIVLQNPVLLQSKKVGVVSQTTQDHETFCRVTCGLVGGPGEIRVFNTICESTSVRQKDAVDLAGRVDVMLVVGGRNSANTSKLYTLVREVQPESYHIETTEDIGREWINGNMTVGITGGASTPDFIIDAVEAHVNKL